MTIKVWDGDGTMISGKACESVGACVIAYGKFQPSGIAGKVTLSSPEMPDG